MNKTKKFKNPYKNKLIAIVKKPIHINMDFCGIFQEIEETDNLRCGLYNINIEKDDIYNTLYVTLKPTNDQKYHFKEFSYNIYEYDKNPTTSLIEIDPNKTFDYNEIFKAKGFVDFINKCLIFKESVECQPDIFYIKYYNSRICYKDEKFYKNDEEIHEFDLIELFYKIPWEYDYDKIELKKYNIFKHLKNFI